MLEASDPPGPWKFYNSNSSEVLFILNLPRAGLWGGPGARAHQWVGLSSPTGTVLHQLLRQRNSCRKGWIWVVTNLGCISINPLEIQAARSHRQVSVCWTLEKEIRATSADGWLGPHSLVEFFHVTVVTPTTSARSSQRWSETPEVKGLDCVLFKYGQNACKISPK